MAAPVGSHVGKILESVRYTMIEFFLIRIGFRIRFAYTFGDDFGVTLFVARIFAILALHACGVFQEFSAKSTAHDIVKLLEDKFMAVEFVDFFFALANSAFTIKTDVEGSSVLELFCYRMSACLHEKYT